MVTSTTTTKRKPICLEECGVLSKSALTRRNMTEKEEERAVLYLSRYKQSWTRLRNLETAGMLLQSLEQSNGFDSSYNSFLLHLSEEKWQVLLPRDQGGYVFYSSFRRVWLCWGESVSPEQGHQGSERDVNKASENAERYALQAI